MSKDILDRRWPWIAAAAVIVLVFLSTFVEIDLSGEWDPRPTGTLDDITALRERDDVNVLFVLIDTLRAERLGSYGYERNTSPDLDRMAASGVRFGRHLAQSSWTKSSMASLWTSLYPARVGITRFDQVLPDAVEMPAEVLARAGFKTAGIYRNGWVAPSFGFDRGFEVYKRPASLPPAPGARRKNPTLTDRSTDEGAILAALEFLRSHGHQRWFLYLHMMDVHEYLYDEESALFGNAHSDIYDNSIRHTNDLFQILIDRLSEAGHRENTIVVVASDHGEAFGERGFEGHAREVYRETTEVPLIISLPFKLDPGIVVETRTGNVDIWPTVFDLLGLEPPDATDGRSRVPEILAAARGEPAPARSTSIAHLDRTWSRPELGPTPTVAVADDAFRYVRFQKTAGEEIERLFDSRVDPAELRDLKEDDPENFERLRQLADGYLASEPVWGEAPTRELEEMELNQLRALGYAVP